MKTKYLQHGFTLIEIIIFIVVMGLISTTILTSMSLVARNIPTMKNNVIANQIAVSVIEWYLGQRYYKGYNSSKLSVCPCSTCTNPDIIKSLLNENCNKGYNVNIECSTSSPGCDGKAITVNVTGLSSSKLSICLADY